MGDALAVAAMFFEAVAVLVIGAAGRLWAKTQFNRRHAIAKSTRQLTDTPGGNTLGGNALGRYKAKSTGRPARAQAEPLAIGKVHPVKAVVYLCVQLWCKAWHQ